MKTLSVIDFSPEGVATAMHSDEVSLSILGKQEIERATEIRFNSETQKWDICMPKSGVVILGRDPESWPMIFDPVKSDAGINFLTYEGARKVEVAWLNQCRLDGYDPESEDGLAILSGVRRNADNSL